MVRYSHIVSTWCWSSLCSERSRCSLPIVFLCPIPRAGQCCWGRWGALIPPGSAVAAGALAVLLAQPWDWQLPCSQLGSGCDFESVQIKFLPLKF